MYVTSQLYFGFEHSVSALLHVAHFSQYSSRNQNHVHRVVSSEIMRDILPENQSISVPRPVQLNACRCRS